MTPLFETAPESIVCHVDHIDEMPEAFRRRHPHTVEGKLALFDVSTNKDCIDDLSAQDPAAVVRILDRFHIWAPRSCAARHQPVLDELFEVTADDFDEVVAVQRNLDNIGQLLRLVLRRCGGIPKARVLDFGCGPGLSIDAARDDCLEIVGYDRCPSMRRRAKERGLTTIDPEEFSASPRGSFHAAIASYVLHLDPDPEELRNLWALLRPGGLLAANFHKDWAREGVTELLASLGAEVVCVEPDTERYSHGSYRIFLRTA